MEDSGRTCTYSFGDDGLTATVSPSGRLLRISRHFRGEKFGYCVDHWSIPEPYMVVNRITSFLSTANDPDYSIGFYPDQDSWVSDVNVAADFTDDRWPTFDIDGQNERCKIQYSISDGAIYQTFEFSNGRPLMAFMPSLLLRQLEFFNGINSFNEADKNNNAYKTHLLNGGKCIKRSHKLDQDDNKHAALFVYAFSGNVALTFEEFTEREDVASKEDSEFGKQGEKKEGEGDEERDEESDQEGDEEGEDDAERTYYRILDDKEVSKPTKVTFIYILSLESGRLESLPSPPKFTFAPKIGNIDGNKERKLTEEPELNVALRRNLEYILSVCSIPVYPDAKEDKEFAVALTCGDIDSHRVTTAASL